MNSVRDVVSDSDLSSDAFVFTDFYNIVEIEAQMIKELVSNFSFALCMFPSMSYNCASSCFHG
jgi:hypothetical protein